MNVGEKLKYLRTRKKLKQKEIAEFLKINPVTYGRYEKGHRQPDYETLKKMSRFYEVSTDYFFSDSYNDLYRDFNDEFEIELYTKYDADYEILKFIRSELLEIEQSVRLITDRIDYIIEGGKPEIGEKDFLRRKLRNLFSRYLENQKKLEDFGGNYDVEDDIIEHLKF